MDEEHNDCLCERCVPPGTPEELMLPVSTIHNATPLVLPPCECPICKNVSAGTGMVSPAPPWSEDKYNGTGTVSPAPPVPEDSHIGDQRMVDPQLTDYEFSGYDGEVVVVLRSRQMALQPIKLLTFSNPHALSMLIRALESVLVTHTNPQEFVKEVKQDDVLMTLQEAAEHTGIPLDMLEEAILLGDLQAYPLLGINGVVLGEYVIKLREVPVLLKLKAEQQDNEVAEVEGR